MPVIDIERVGEPGAEAAQAACVQALAEALGALWQAAPGRVWVRLRHLPRCAYAENGVPAAQTPAPVWVTVLHADPPQAAARRAEALALTQAVAGVLGVPAQGVHVLYAAGGRGRVAFGGQWVPVAGDDA